MAITKSALKEFVEATVLCDSENASIKEKARQVTERSSSETESAISIFNYVRDSILFGFTRPDVKASTTLKKGFGYCVTKTNL